MTNGCLRVHSVYIPLSVGMNICMRGALLRGSCLVYSAWPANFSWLMVGLSLYDSAPNYYLFSTACSDLFLGYLAKRLHQPLTSLNSNLVLETHLSLVLRNLVLIKVLSQHSNPQRLSPQRLISNTLVLKGSIPRTAVLKGYMPSLQSSVAVSGLCTLIIQASTAPVPGQQDLALTLSIQCPAKLFTTPLVYFFIFLGENTGVDLCHYCQGLFRVRLFLEDNPDVSR